MCCIILLANYYHMKNLVPLLIFAMITNSANVMAQPIQLFNAAPVIGAEVFIEPGQSEGYIDSLFAILQKHHMQFTRIRMFENYMHLPDGSWDFTLFDKAYRAAEKYGIGIWGNFFAATAYEDVGGFKFPRNKAHLDSVAEYIQQVVQHFKVYKSHAGWALLNEIGSGKLPDTELTQQYFLAWQKEHAWQKEPGSFNGFSFEQERFLVAHNTWFVQWLAGQVRRYDPHAHLHINNHAIFQTVAEFDFPAWRPHLSSLGGSAHASWHFGYFDRQHYTHAMAANGAILASGAGQLPWVMTEMQGGNNTYSGYHAMCPTAAEITQWIWTVVAQGGKGAMFWALNPRGGGFEAGEWAMLDYQLQPSDRLLAAGKVADILKKHSALFAAAKPLPPVVHLLFTRPSLWIEQKMQMGGSPIEGRMVGGVMKSLIGYYETLLEMGVSTAISDLDAFDFSKDDYTGVVLVLAHQIALPNEAVDQLEHFVSHGGTLLADGLTGFYDIHARANMQAGFPLEKLLGGKVKEYKMEGNLVPLALKKGSIILPGHAWRGYLAPTTGTLLAGEGAHCYAIENNLGKGRVYWIPTLLGLGSRLHGNTPLAQWLQQVLVAGNIKPSVQFDKHYPMVILQSLQTKNGYITVVINKSETTQSPTLQVPDGYKPKLIFGSKQAMAGTTFTLQPEETIVVYWEKA